MSVPTDRGLVADFSVHRQDFRLELRLEVPQGRVTAIVGPNGAGKSSALRTIAGLLRPAGGRIELNGRALDDAASGRHIAPAHRDTGVVFQDYLLFPHLTAVENVAFGLIARRIRRRDAARRALGRLDRLGLADLADRHPAELSGGQKQRVALARALVLEPPLLLMDEPLAALDPSIRLDVRADLGRQLRSYGGVTVIVTHDPVDALALADEVVVLDAGSAVQRGTPAAIARAPENAFVADLLGLNLLPTASGRIVFSPLDTRVTVDRPADEAGQVTVRCRVLGVEESRGRTRVLLATTAGGIRLTADLDPRRFATLSLTTGAEVWASARTEA